MVNEESDAGNVRGNIAFAVKDYKKAIDEYTDAMNAANPLRGYYYSNRSGAYRMNKQFVNALKDAIKCTRIAPKWWKSHVRLAEAYLALKQWPDAVEAYQVGLRLCAKSTSLQEGLKAALAIEAAVKNGVTGSVEIGDATVDATEIEEEINTNDCSTNGERAGATGSCAQCMGENKSAKCQQCRLVFYCNRDCQKKHWKVHKPQCNKPSE